MAVGSACKFMVRGGLSVLVRLGKSEEVHPAPGFRVLGLPGLESRVECLQFGVQVRGLGRVTVTIHYIPASTVSASRW